jgi:hypothetical protein
MRAQGRCGVAKGQSLSRLCGGSGRCQEQSAGDGEFTDDDEEIGAICFMCSMNSGQEVLGATEGDFDLAHGLNDRFDAGEVASLLAPHGEGLEAEACETGLSKGMRRRFAAKQAAVGELEGGDGRFPAFPSFRVGRRGFSEGGRGGAGR